MTWRRKSNKLDCQASLKQAIRISKDSLLQPVKFVNSRGLVDVGLTESWELVELPKTVYWETIRFLSKSRDLMSTKLIDSLDRV